MRFQIITSLLILMSSACGRLVAQPQESSKSVIARAGDIYVTEEEFLQRYELLPAPNRSIKGGEEQSKLELLYSIIAEKLLAEEAQKPNLEKDSGFVAVFLDMRRKLGRDELYRLEIQRKVSVSKAEVSRAIPRALKRLSVQYIYCDNKADADFIRSRLGKIFNFDQLHIDTTFHAIRDTIEVSWGEAEQPLEDAAYSLKRNEVSPVIKAGSGYYIVRVIKTTPDPYYAGLESNALRERVEERLRLRKERKRLDEYVSVALKDQTGYSLPRSFLALSKAFDRILKTAGDHYPIAISQEMMQTLKKELAASLDDTLMVANQRVWSVGEVLDRLYQSGFTFDSVGVQKVPERLNFQLRQWDQQEILGEEALRLGLDRNPGVAKQLQMWHDYFLSVMMEDHITSDIGLKEVEVLSFMKYKDPTLVLPKVRVRELHTSTLEEMKSAVEDLHKGVPFSDLITKWMTASAVDSAGRWSDSFAIDERPPIGELAWKTDVGKYFGPLKKNGGFSLFQVAAKRDTQFVRSEQFAARMDSAAKELLAMKRKRAVDVFLAKTGEELGFDIYQDRLKMIKVTHIPMMTYRILGFGGRMVAVPFVRPRLDWLDIKVSRENTIF